MLLIFPQYRKTQANGSILAALLGCMRDIIQDKRYNLRSVKRFIFSGGKLLNHVLYQKMMMKSVWKKMNTLF